MRTVVSRVVLIAIGLASLAASPPTQPASTVFTKAKAAVAAKQFVVGEAHGFGPKDFQDVAPEGGILVGLELGLGRFVQKETIHSVRPIFLTAKGALGGPTHGGVPDPKKKPAPGQRPIVERVITLRAKTGYAIGGMTVRSGVEIHGLSVQFMEIDGDKLNPEKSYESEWVGTQPGGRESKFGGDGSLVLGINGKSNDTICNGLALIVARETAPAKADPPPAPVKSPRKVIAQPKPLEKPAVAGTEWTLLSDPKLRASILMPGRPAPKQSTVKTVMGPLQLTVYELSDASGGVWGLTYNDYPVKEIKDRDRVLDGSRDGVARNLSGQIKSEKKFDVDGHPGREALINVPGKGTMAIRLILVNERLYQLMRAGANISLDDPDVRKFFDSFKITDK